LKDTKCGFIGIIDRDIDTCKAVYYSEKIIRTDPTSLTFYGLYLNSFHEAIERYSNREIPVSLIHKSVAVAKFIFAARIVRQKTDRSLRLPSADECIVKKIIRHTFVKTSIL